MSILKGKTSFLWSLVCLGSPLLFIESPTKNCIKMIFKENRTFPILSEDIERVLSKWWTYWKVPQNSKIIKLLVSKPLRISVPQIRGWTVGCLRRGSRINTHRFPKRAPKAQIARWDPGHAPTGAPLYPCVYFTETVPERIFLIFF